MKLGLGTAQFGLDYGVSNLRGRVPRDEVRAILQLAEDQGISTLDTAALYGDSEEAIGQALPPHHRFRIITKTLQFKKQSISADDVSALEQTFHASLKKLRQGRVYGLLVHHAEDLLVPGGEGIVDAMQRLRDQGLVERIGASVYTPAEARCLPRTFDLVQVPLNLLDQRMISTATLTWLKENQFEVHARSVFLQGLLLMSPSQVPASLQPHARHLDELRDACARLRLSPMQLALAFIAQQAQVDHMVIGVCSRKELEEILGTLHSLPDFRYDFSVHASQEERLINPSFWG